MFIHFEEKLLGMDYEVFLQFMSELPKTDFFNSPIILSEYNTTMKHLNITQVLIDQLNDEYDQILTMSQECKSNSPKTAAPLSTHFIKTNKDQYQIIYLTK